VCSFGGAVGFCTDLQLLWCAVGCVLLGEMLTCWEQGYLCCIELILVIFLVKLFACWKKTGRSP